jgi:hypothetical protein
MTWTFTVKSWPQLEWDSPSDLRELHALLTQHGWVPDAHEQTTTWEELATINEPFTDPIGGINAIPYGSRTSVEADEAFRRLHLPKANEVYIGPFGPRIDGESCLLHVPVGNSASRVFISSAWFLPELASHLWQGDREAMAYDLAHIDDPLDYTTAWYLGAIEQRVKAVNATLAHFVYVCF